MANRPEQWLLIKKDDADAKPVWKLETIRDTVLTRVPPTKKKLEPREITL